MRAAICRRDDGTMVNQCPPDTFLGGWFFPVTPTRCALRCHGLRVNQRPPDALCRVDCGSDTRGFCRGDWRTVAVIQPLRGRGVGGWWLPQASLGPAGFRLPWGFEDIASSRH